jgi:hypothetical protein
MEQATIGAIRELTQGGAEIERRLVIAVTRPGTTALGGNASLPDGTANTLRE